MTNFLLALLLCFGDPRPAMVPEPIEIAQIDVITIPNPSVEKVVPQSIPVANASRALAMAEFESMIVGPKDGASGTLVKLDASSVPADTFGWTLAGGGKDNFDIANDGRTVYFSPPISPSKAIYVFVWAATKNGTDGGKPSLMMGQHILTVPGTAPPAPLPVDPTKPQPPAPPAPVVEPLPAGRFNLAEFTKQTILKNAASLDLKLATEYANNFGLVAKQIDAKTLTTQQAVNAKLKELNSPTIAKQQAWSVVQDALKDQLVSLANAKQLSPTNIADLKSAYEEISLGFASVGK